VTVMPHNARPIVICDLCAGYGGMLLGAMAASSNKPVHFIGIDPNSSNRLAGGRSRYDVLFDLFRASVGPQCQATLEIYHERAEVMHQQPAFMRHRGQIDLFMTSPPYFCAEHYSDEPTQSANMYPTYPTWHSGFLRRTLRMCATWLRPGGHVLWNISDISIKGTYYPLEQDSVDAMLEFGLIFEEKLKMPLGHPPGGAIGRTGLPKMKNFCIVHGVLQKYEPIFVFRKPIKGERIL
jgi:hypothetical protein